MSETKKNAAMAPKTAREARALPEVMSLLREQYERVLVIAAALLLLVCSIFIWRNAAGFRPQLGVMPPGAAPKSASPMAKAQELGAALEKLHQPPQWTSGDSANK